MYPLVGLVFTTSVLDSHPALTNTARMRELICCAPVISLLAARLKYALFRAVERHRKLTQRKKDRRPVCQDGLPSRQSVRHPLPQTCGQDGRGTVPSVLTSSPFGPVHPGAPDIRVTDRHLMKKEKSHGRRTTEAASSNPRLALFKFNGISTPHDQHRYKRVR